jgi:hypothetical protein
MANCSRSGYVALSDIIIACGKGSSGTQSVKHPPRHAPSSLNILRRHVLHRVSFCIAISSYQRHAILRLRLSSFGAGNAARGVGLNPCVAAGRRGRAVDNISVAEAAAMVRRTCANPVALGALAGQTFVLRP